MSLKVFIFDDDDLILTTLSYFLKQEGYEVHAFSQPDHCALFYSEKCSCEAESPCADIIITDVNMPGDTGLNFISNQIRKGCKVEHIAIMSGDWSNPAMLQAKNIGCMIFRKPFSIIDLKQWLDGIKKDFDQRNIEVDIPVLKNFQGNETTQIQNQTKTRRLPKYLK